MDRLTHAWIALRAIKLLEDTPGTGNLSLLLKAHAPDIVLGAYLPDMGKANPAGMSPDCHVLKIKPLKVEEDPGKRFIKSKQELLKDLGTVRKMNAFIEQDGSLDDAWWKTPYKGEVPHPGNHIPNRAMGFSMTMKDLLLFGEQGIFDETKHPEADGFLRNALPVSAQTNAKQAAVHFLILSHFVADACMPCHCDDRDLASFSGGLHHELEQQWSAWIRGAYAAEGVKIGTGTQESQFLAKPANAKTVQAKLDAVDAILKTQIGLQLPVLAKIPELPEGTDVWLDLMNVCRASFTVASIMVDPQTYPYGSKKLSPFDTLFPDPDKDTKLKAFSDIILSDAVLNVATVWMHIWDHVMSALLPDAVKPCP